jgi:hypothetical protein
MFVATTLMAQEPEKKPIVGEASPAVEALRLAGDLVKYGYAHQSAMPLLNALEILQTVSTKDLDGQRQAGTSTKADSGKKEGVLTFDKKQILADAKDFAKAEENEAVSALIAAYESKSGVQQRGRVGGASTTYERVNANSTDVYQISFVANRRAEIVVVGDGDTDLDLYVYDSNGNLIESDTDYTDNCYVSWTPLWTGRFTVKVKNRGSVYNNYVIITN